MRHIGFLFALICCINFICCQSATKSASPNSQNNYSLTKDSLNSNNIPEISLITDAPTYDFGNIIAGDTVIHTFHFKNTGNIPLIISSATATCGCTVAAYNKHPIKPNQVDSITLVFKSSREGKGFQNKVVTIIYNSPKSPKLLTVYGRTK